MIGIIVAYVGIIFMVMGYLAVNLLRVIVYLLCDINERIPESKWAGINNRKVRIFMGILVFICLYPLTKDRIYDFLHPGYIFDLYDYLMIPAFIASIWCVSGPLDKKYVISEISIISLFLISYLYWFYNLEHALDFHYIEFIVFVGIPVMCLAWLRKRIKAHEFILKYAKFSENNLKNKLVTDNAG